MGAPPKFNSKFAIAIEKLDRERKQCAVNEPGLDGEYKKHVDEA